MKKKSIILATLMIITNLLVSTIWAQNTDQAQKRFDSFTQIYQEALVLNQGKFTDLNLIQIGDTVFLPNLFQPGVVAWIADEPINGQHDCIWVLSEKYWQKTLTTLPVDTIQVKIPKILPASQETQEWTRWEILRLGWLAVGIFILLIILVVWLQIKWEKFRDMNPDKHPPVGSDLDLLTRSEAVNSLSALKRFLKSSERIIKLQRGQIRRSYGPKKIKVNMSFGDDKERNVTLKAGERVTQVVVQDDDGKKRTVMFRTVCSNGFGSDEFALPDGWYFTPDNVPVEQNGDVPVETIVREVSKSTSPQARIEKNTVDSTESPTTNSSKLDLEPHSEIIYALAYLMAEIKEMDPQDFTTFEVEANFGGTKNSIKVNIKK